MTNQITPIRVVVLLGNGFERALGLLNPNAFPAFAKELATGCAERLGDLLQSAHTIEGEASADPGRLIDRLQTDRAFRGFQPDPQKPAVLFLHSPALMSAMYFALVTAKAMLDVYAQLVSRMIVPGSSVRGFSKAKYDGTEIAGGRFLNWLDRSAPAFESRDALRAAVLAHIDAWINEAVSYRDAIVHSGFIRGLDGASAPIDRTPTELRVEHVKPPTMPGGRRVTEYYSGLAQNALNLLRETLPLVPNVEVGYLDLR